MKKIVGYSYILRVVLVIIMEFHWFMDAFCKDAPCMIVAVDTQVGVAWLIDFHKRVW